MRAALPSNPPPEVGIPSARQSRFHRASRLESRAERTPGILRQVRGDFDAPRLQHGEPRCSCGLEHGPPEDLAHAPPDGHAHGPSPVPLRSWSVVSGSCSGCRARARAHRQGRPLQGSPRPASDIGFLGQCEVDLLRVPPGKRSARSVPRDTPHPRRTWMVKSRRANRRLPRHQHPDLGKTALLADVELAPAHVRGVVHLQHHLRQRFGVHVDGRPLQTARG